VTIKNQSESIFPKGWIETTLGDLCIWGSGGTPSRSDPTYFNGGIPWVTISDLNDSIVTTTANSISQKGLENSSAKLVPTGATMVALYGSIGKLGISGNPLTTNQAIAYAIPDDNAFHGRYLFHFLRWQRDILLNLGSGVTQKNIYLGDLKAFKIPVAPRAEQTRIVEKLEELLSDLDAGVNELKAAQKKLGQYRQSLLKAAVEGELTAEWRSNNKVKETGAHLLQRILKERRTRWETKQLAKYKEQNKTPPRGWKEKYPEPVKPDTTDLPNLPEDWVWGSLDQLSEIQGGIQKQPSRAPVVNKYPFLRVANVARGRLKLDEIHEIELLKGELERLALQKGDVLIVEGNGSISEIGRCALWDGSIENAVHQNHLIRARPIIIESQFVETWLNSLRGIEKMTKLAATTSGLYTLSVGKISKVPVPIPPAEEQHAALTILIVQAETLLQQELNVQHSLKQSAAQRKNILKAAFSGQLVPQNPNDEPASVLLERIRTERTMKVAPAKKLATKKTITKKAKSA
jgi:type I restriction enzyme, S subunit